MKLTLYGQDDEKGWAKTISLDEVVALQKETIGDLWAHAEEGCNESCYVRVARWNYDSERWEAFAGLKCMDYRFPEAPDATDEETAELAAKKINEGFSWSTNGRTRIIWNMPVWQSDDGAFPNLTMEERGMTERVQLADGRTVDLPEVVLKCLKQRFTREGERAAKLAMETSGAEKGGGA